MRAPTFDPTRRSAGGMGWAAVSLVITIAIGVALGAGSRAEARQGDVYGLADHERLCVGGDALHCFQAGQIRFERGEALRALGVLDQACTAGVPAACLVVAHAYEQGLQGLQADAEAAQDYHRRACEAGSGRGCRAVGRNPRNYQVGLTVPDHADILADREAACASGTAAACFSLGLLRQTGQVSDPDPSGARNAYRRACEGGHGAACAHLGHLFLGGALGQSDELLARHAYERSCEDGQLEPCVRFAALAIERYPDQAEAAISRAHEGLMADCHDFDDGQACREAAAVIWNGMVPDLGTSGALPLLARGCRLGEQEACESERVVIDVEAARIVAFCLMRSDWTCLDRHTLFLDGGYRTNDPDYMDIAFRRALDRACSAGQQEACETLPRLPRRADPG